jgi:hypothetical protein
VVFRYDVIRLWQEPMATLLAAGPGVAPLAPLTNEASRDVSGAFDRVLGHLQAAGLPVTLIRDLIGSSLILGGLRYGKGVIGPINTRLGMGINLEESSTYQLLIEEGKRRGLAEGEARGRLQGELDRARQSLVRFGQTKFGPPSAEVVASIQGIPELDRFDRMEERLATASGWDDLLATP